MQIWWNVRINYVSFVFQIPVQFQFQFSKIITLLMFLGLVHLPLILTFPPLIFRFPPDFTLDNTTLIYLDHTYNLLDHSLTLRLTKLREDISHLQTASTTTVNDIFTYLTFALTILNCFVLLIFVRRLRQPLQIPTISLSTRDTSKDG